MFSGILTAPAAIAVWVIFGVVVVLVIATFGFVAWEAKKGIRDRENSARSGSICSNEFETEPGTSVSGGSHGSRESHSPSIFIVVPDVEDHDEDEYFGSDGHHILESRSSVTEIYMRTTRSHSEGAVKATIHKHHKKKSLEWLSQSTPGGRGPLGVGSTCV